MFDGYILAFVNAYLMNIPEDKLQDIIDKSEALSAASMGAATC
jgi:hypothetical protein